MTALIEAFGTFASVSEWVAFLRVVEDEYAQIAAERGKPCRRLCDDERLSVAELAAGPGGNRVMR